MKRVIQFFSAVIFLLQPGIAGADKAASFNRRGIEAYKQQQYEESLRQFTEAAVERPETPSIIFNRGTALSSLGKKDEAVSTLLNAARGFNSREQSAAAHFNTGNTLFAAEDYQGALEQYRRAVKLDQDSEDIRHNLELTLRKLTDQQSRQSDQDNQQKNDQKQDRQKQQNPNQNQQQKQDREQQQSKQRENELRPMTKEEAERLLNAINDEERKSLSLRNQRAKGAIPQGNDW